MANIFSVSSKDELLSALSSATGGDTIELAGGDYGWLGLETFKTGAVQAIYDTPVTITSANPDDQASFSGMKLDQVRNLTFDNIIFDSNHTGGEVWASPFSIRNSTDVTIRNSLFEGELASGTGDPTTDGFATGKGLDVSGSSAIVIENNEFSTWHRGLVVGGSQDVTVVGNDVHSIRSDGMNFAHVQNVLIEDNHIHDFVLSQGSGDHSDMIQFWTTGGTSPSTDIVIRGNTLDVGDGDATQSIFMRNGVVDQGQAGEEMFYQNLLIEENIILNNHTHGITVGETNSLIIRNNSVLDADASLTSSVATPKISVASPSKNVTIEENATAAINGYGDQSDWEMLNNVLVQNSSKSAPGYYENEFINSSIGGRAEDYILDPSGTIAQAGAGASRLHFDTVPDSLRPAFDVSSDADSENTVVFDASYTHGPNGAVTEADAQFIWDFGDGTSATGQVVSHTYPDAGRYEVLLTVVLPDGIAAATAQSTIGIMGADLLSFDPQTGLFNVEAYGTTTAITNSDSASVSVDGNQDVDLGGAGSQLHIGSGHLSRLFGSDSFDMSMTLQADTPGSNGEVARVHGNFILSITSGGEVRLQLWTDVERATLTTSGAQVNDGLDHAIRIAFDGATDSLMIYVDDQLAGAKEVEGAMRSDYPRGLSFGNPWGDIGDNFDGTLKAFQLEAENQDYPAGDNEFIGGPGPDTLTGGAGNDLLDGGAGVDVAVYTGNQSSYTLALSPTTTTLTDRRPDGNGTDTLIDIELLDFDTEIPAMGGNSMNLDQFSGSVALNENQFADLIALYIAYFNRAPDATGLYFWATAFSNGLTLEEIAARFDTSAETRALYPDDSSNAEFVQAVYNNVLGRDPDQVGFNFWLGHLDSGTVPREVFILRLLNGAQGTDIDYIENKVDIGIYFTVIKGMSNGQNGKDVMELFDGSQQSIENAIVATDQFYANALDPTHGEFLIPLVGVLDNPFAVA